MGKLNEGQAGSRFTGLCLASDLIGTFANFSRPVVVKMLILRNGGPTGSNGDFRRLSLCIATEIDIKDVK